MKSYLLLFFSILLLLFTLPNPDRNMSRFVVTEQAVLKKTCNSKRLAKRTCAKKCLKHQTHSEQQNAANFATDCSQHLYAVVAAEQFEVSFAPFAFQPAARLTLKKHLSPHLESEPDPPRLA
jgi:hypothetical protein